MAATREQKRRQQAALRRAIQIIRAERPDVWADAYRRAKIVTGATLAAASERRAAEYRGGSTP